MSGFSHDLARHFRRDTACRQPCNAHTAPPTDYTEVLQQIQPELKPVIGQGQVAVLGTSMAKRLNALMLTCGTHDAAGDVAFRVGLPAKSGVGFWSPALERFTTLTGRSIF